MATTTTTDSATWGETYDLEAQAKDVDGVAIVMDGTWSAACRFTKARVNGETVLAEAMTIADGVATLEVDTGAAAFDEPGVYFYDIRLTDADGNDYWSEPVKLTLKNRNTLPS